MIITDKDARGEAIRMADGQQVVNGDGSMFRVFVPANANVMRTAGGDFYVDALVEVLAK